MRLVLAFAVLAASACSAHAAEDRYGPSTTAAATGVGPAPYAGPTLSWNGNTAAATPPAPLAAEPVRPDLMPGGLYRSAPAPQAPLASVTPVRPAAAPTGYAPPAYSPQTSAPQSLYSRPTPSAPMAALAPPPSQTAIQGGLYASGGPHYYSVHRAYGMTPDPIQMPPPGVQPAFRPEASLAGAVALSGVGDGVRKDDTDDGGMAGVGAEDEADEAQRAAKRDAERLAARRAAAAGGGQ